MASKSWTREQLLVAFGLYCQIPFGKMHSRNPVITEFAALIDRTPSALAMKLTNIASLDPAIISTGRKGLSGASAADRDMWDEIQDDWESFVLATDTELDNLRKSKNCVNGAALAGIDKKDYTGQESEAKVKTRIGQVFFRRSVLSSYNSQCCISGLSLPSLLVASHIVPWKSDPSNRLNPQNGLLLSSLHDKAFDIGILTINDDMTIRISEKDLPEEDGFFQNAIKFYHRKKIALPEKFSPCREFLAYHRENIFQS